MLKLTADEIRSSTSSKFDMLFKNMFLEYESYLMEMLGITEGRSYSIELPGFDGRRIDGIVVNERSIDHVEFQHRATSTMKWRMLEYYFKIVDRFQKMNGFGDQVSVFQKLIYVGGGLKTAMDPPLRRDCLNFSYECVDLRQIAKGEWPKKLRDSARPFDWILGVLCKEKAGNSDWVQLAAKVTRHEGESRADSMDLRSAVLVAAVLREIDINLLRRIEEMLDLNVKNSPFLSEAYERVYSQAFRRGEINFLIRTSGAKSEAMTATVIDWLEGLEEEKFFDAVTQIQSAPSASAVSQIVAGLKSDGFAMK